MKQATRPEYRKFTIYGSPPGSGSGLVVQETDDGAMISVAERTGHYGAMMVDAEQLMQLTQQLAGIFGYAVMSPTEWRDRLVEVITVICENNESRCLDDDVDRRVVIHELVTALAAAAMPKPC